MPDYKPDRRSLPRVSAHFRLRVDLVIPEQMRLRVVLEARLHDINEAGCRARVEMSHELYELIRKSRCEAYVDFNGRAGLPEKLFARPVWVEEKVANDDSVCYLGFQFENCRQEDKEAIRAFLLVPILHEDMD